MSLRVLTVDDYKPLRRSIVRKLAQIDPALSCFEADSLPSAVRALAHQPELILLDLQLQPQSNDRSGLTLLNDMEEQGLRAFVAVVSHHDDLKTKLIALGSGADAFVSKDDLSSTRLRELIALADRKASRLARPVEVVRYIESLRRPLPEALRVVERDVIRTAVERAQGDVEEAARQLGMHPRAVYRRIRQTD
jgi:DNA-binding NtrC family response regulator